MKVMFSPRNIVSIVMLTAAWCAMWRTISIANIAGGLILAMLVTFSGIGTSGVGSIRIGPLLRLLGVVLKDLFSSTVSVAYEVLTPADHTDEAVIGVELPDCARHHLLFMTLAITLTPGTAVVEADTEANIIYVHLLHGDERDAVVAHVKRLADLTCEALPVGTRSSESAEVAS